MNVLREERPFSCSVCDKTFRFKRNLTMHLRIHTGEKRIFTCTHCAKSFRFKANFFMHLRIHGEKPYVCTVCDKPFSTSQYLSKHMKSHLDVKPFPCFVCGKTFAFKTNLKIHMYVHTGERPFPCHVCGKRFKQKAVLSIHVKIHTGESMVSCTKCGKKYSNKANLKRHDLLAHPVETPSPCLIYERSVHSKGQMERHRRKPVKRKKILSCSICGENFKSSKVMIRHLTTHTSQGQYFCDTCGKRFSDEGILAIHHKLHTNSCPVCDKIFSFRINMSRHLKKTY